MKQFAAWFTHGIPNGASLRKSIFEARSGPAVLAAVESFFATRVNHAELIDSVLEGAMAKEEMLACTKMYCD